MNIFVCIKQVPSTNKVQVDEKTGVLKRDGIASKMNPYDLFALETALRLKEKHGGKVTVGTMGPPQAQAVVREAYMMGADEGYVFSDRRLGGADVLATSYTLSQAIQSVGDFDLILCGKQTIDGKEYLLMKALKADFAILNAHLVDKNGNMWFKGTTRNFNPLMATAGETVIVEADNVVECGDILPENVHTTGAVVNYIVDGGKA